ncbi:MAG: hypothetical protein ACTS2F_12705 [Thainema sp.]
MADPVTLTVGAIAALALAKFLESSAEHAAEKLTPAVLEKMNALRKKIWQKLSGHSDVEELKKTVESGQKVSDAQINNILVPKLEAAMQQDQVFAKEIQQLAHEINQEINIGEILGENVMNVYGGSAVQINNPNAPVIQGVSGGTINITYNN